MIGRSMTTHSKRWWSLPAISFFAAALCLSAWAATAAAEEAAGEAPEHSTTADAPLVASGSEASKAHVHAHDCTDVSVDAPVDAAAEAARSGLWVFIDPDTGEQIAEPTPEQRALIRSFKSSVNKSTDGLVPFKLEGGGQGYYLAGRFRHSLQITRQEDGSYSFSCSDHPGEHLHVAAPRTTAPQEATEAAVR